MAKITINEKRWRYAELAQIVGNLQETQKNYLESAKLYQTKSADEETGEINENSWEWMEHLEYLERATAISNLIADLEQL